MMYLYHHGIKGQKWGVRRFQDLLGRWTAAGRERYGSAASQIKETALTISDSIGAKGRHKALLSKYRNRDIQDLKSAPRIEDKSSTESNIKIVNPGYPSRGTINNCGFVTVALALREKGYDVVANESEKGYYDTNICEMFNGPKQFDKITASNNDDVKKAFMGHGEGAYGAVSVSWKGGGGHFMLWKNANGSTVFYDGQDGTSYNLNSPKTLNILDYVKLDDLFATRLDNVEPNELALSAVRRKK